MSEPLARLRHRMAGRGIGEMVLSHPETVADLAGFEQPFEDWPVANSLVASPTLLLVNPVTAALIVPAFYLDRAAECDLGILVADTYMFVGEPPDAMAEFESVLSGWEFGGGPVGVEPGALPLRVAESLRARGCDLVDIERDVIECRRTKVPSQLARIRGACRLADHAQRALKEAAEVGQSELELAGIAHTAMHRAAERRVPAIVTVTTGKETGGGGGVAGPRVVRLGDIVLTDTSPWYRGAWSDTANAVVVGPPTNEHRRVFDAVRRALYLGIDLCVPGAVAGDVDRRVRECLEPWGPTYGHHTGHGLGAAWCEPPLLVPNSVERLEDGMVLALEPAIYRVGWGGMRLEHVFVVRQGGNEVLTEFEHTL